MFYQEGNSHGNYNYNACVYSNIEYLIHFHNNFELIYVFNGSVSVNTNGAEIILKNGEMLLIMPNRPHAFKVTDDASVWVGVFSGDHVSEFEKEYGEYCFSKFRAEKTAENYLKSRLFFGGTPPLYDRISCLNTVCAQCVRFSRSEHVHMYDEPAHNIIQHVYNNFADNITLKDVARELGYEYHYLSGLFNKYFSVGFSEFVNRCRFEKACELLKNENKSISEIAMESGFGCLRSFNRIFKTFSGVTPKEYKKYAAISVKGNDGIRKMKS